MDSGTAASVAFRNVRRFIWSMMPDSAGGVERPNSAHQPPAPLVGKMLTRRYRGSVA